MVTLLRIVGRFQRLHYFAAIDRKEVGKLKEFSENRHLAVLCASWEAYRKPGESTVTTQGKANSEQKWEAGGAER